MDLRVIAVATLAVVLSGCSTVRQGHYFDPEVIESFSVGEATREQVGRALGAPVQEQVRVNDFGRFETLTYHYAEQDAFSGQFRQFRNLELEFLDGTLNAYMLMATTQEAGWGEPVTGFTTLERRVDTRESTRERLGRPDAVGRYPTSLAIFEGAEFDEVWVYFDIDQRGSSLEIAKFMLGFDRRGLLQSKGKVVTRRNAP